MIKTITPKGPFNLVHQNQYFNGWPTLASDQSTIVMTFPVEGWKSSAAVTMHQQKDDTIEIGAYGTDDEHAITQAMAAVSLDEDGAGWAAVGERDGVIKGLQKQYQYMRPTLFHSPYEAAAAFIIGHRITIPQTRKIRAAMAAEHGQQVTVLGESFYAFPEPQKLLGIREYPGLNEVKISRLHAVAQRALEGKLNRDYLRSLRDEEALAELETLSGVGPFFSQGILYRGAGKKDSLTNDDMTNHAIVTVYHLDKHASRQEIERIAEQWHPYRMWATVLLHVCLRETNNFPKRTFSGKRS